VINRLCGSIGCYTRYNINGKEFFVLFHFVQIDMAALFKRPGWKLLPNAIVIPVNYSFTFEVKVNIILPSGEYCSGE